MQVPDIARELPSTRPQAFKLRESTEDKSRVLATWAALLRPLLPASLLELSGGNSADTCRTTFSAFRRQVSKSSNRRPQLIAESAKLEKRKFKAASWGLFWSGIGCFPKHRASIDERTYTGLSKTTPDQMELID